MIVDGSFTLRPELRGIWAASIWLDADSAVRKERIAQRDGIVAGSAQAGRYSGAHELYLRTSPRDAASVTIDNSDPDSPERT